jgi:hypothetical protein
LRLYFFLLSFCLSSFSFRLFSLLLERGKAKKERRNFKLNKEAGGVF